MMMHNKLYLLLLILSVFVICSISIDQKPRNGDFALDAKKKGLSRERDEKRRKDNQEKFNKADEDDVDDSGGSLSSYADNRYTSVPSEGNYRTRPRWPSPRPPPPPPSSPYDDFMDASDWSRFEFPGAFPSPLQSMLFDTTPLLNSGPTCNSLVDPQYPIFSDTCGAVPQARYTLPNVFGHRERWQVAQILTAILSSSNDATCTRSLRLLLCPVLFPPCPTRHEPSPVLPCQSYCRAVKAQCAIPALELLPCEVLPYSSDLCPTNQGYGSLIPPSIFPSLNQPVPTPSVFPTANFQMSQSFPSLQALFGSQGFQSAFNPSAVPTLNPSPAPTSVPSAPAPAPATQQTVPFNLYNGGPFAMDSLNSMMNDYSFLSYPNDYRQASRYVPSAPTPAPAPTPATQQTVPFNLYNGGPFAMDSLNSMMNDYSSRSYPNDYRQAPRYVPITRSSVDARPTAENRPQTGSFLSTETGLAKTARPSAVSSVVKA